MGLLQSIYEKVRPLRVAPPMPVHLTASVQLVESDEAAARPDRSSGYGMIIDYVDAVGAESFRRISCRKVDLSTGCLQAYCLERRAFRAFRIDRIRNAFSLETGEEIEVGHIIEDLRRRGLPIDDGRLGRALTALSFLMRCDGEAHPLERSAIDLAVSSFVIQFELPDSAYDEGIKLAGDLAPEGQDFVRTLKWVAKHPDRQRLSRYLMRQACELIDADGRIAAEEVTFGGELSDYLKKLATA